MVLIQYYPSDMNWLHIEPVPGSDRQYYAMPHIKGDRPACTGLVSVADLAPVLFADWRSGDAE